ncbi:MAG: oligoendopeptidase, partial [Solirubrobacteraceae bacterium]|nr:oligoendopeptidase [Solirubrobacteraceae bacterium]
MSAPEAIEDPELDTVAWDLSTLLEGAGDGDPGAAVDAMLAQAQERADTLAEAHAGRVAELDGAGLVGFMTALAEIEELAGRAGSFAMLEFSENTADPARGALLQRVQERGTAIETALLFFELEWAALDDDRAEELLAAEG